MHEDRAGKVQQDGPAARAELWVQIIGHSWGVSRQLRASWKGTDEMALDSRIKSFALIFT